MASGSKKKNNHFVPRSYLRRFCSGSDREISLFNIKSGKTITSAPIKSQCSRDYFYTKNPLFEDEFAKIEVVQKFLLDEILSSQIPPQPGSRRRSELSSGIMFQAGRTASAVVLTDHLTNQFGKSLLRHHFERNGKVKLLEHLPRVEISMVDAVMDSIGQHLLMGPLIDDLDCTLFLNATSEDFLTSDHPVVLCNSLPGGRASDRKIGFASPGLIMLYPISPRAILFLSDPKAYAVESQNGRTLLRREQDIVDLNLAQFGNAHENVYFSNAANVQRTLHQFKVQSDAVRIARPDVSETTFKAPDGRNGILLHMLAETRRQRLPSAVQVRYSFRRRKQKEKNTLTRDIWRTSIVNERLVDFQKRREKATRDAKMMAQESLVE